MTTDTALAVTKRVVDDGGMFSFTSPIGMTQSPISER